MSSKSMALAALRRSWSRVYTRAACLPTGSVARASKSAGTTRSFFACEMRFISAFTGKRFGSMFRLAMMSLYRRFRSSVS